MTLGTPAFRRRGLMGAAAATLAAPGILAAPLLGPRRAAAQGAAPGAVIDITRARTDPIPIAIPNFAGAGEGQRLGAMIAQVIQNNLRNSGLFRPVERQAFIQTPEAAAQTPRFQDWRVIGAAALTTGRAEVQGDRVRVEFRLWDVLPEQQLQGTAFTAPMANWRRIAHLISDVIYERLLGEKGYFDTRVVYVAESGPRDRRNRRLAIMDQDGENHRFLTDGSFQALTPRFHPNAQQIAFMSYFNNQPRVTLFNLDSGRQEVLGNFPGMTLSPRFAPDGRSVVLSAVRGGDANIFVVDLGSRRERQLTSGGGLDVSPSFSPDGSQIVFNSDRGGDQQLYVMDAGGGGVRRISFGRGRYATPVWSRARPDRLHPLRGRQLRHRRHAPGRQRRADPVRGLADGRPDLRAERPRDDVLPREPGARCPRRRLFLAPRLDRHRRLQRAPDRHADGRLRPRLVAAAGLRGARNGSARSRGLTQSAKVSAPFACQGWLRSPPSALRPEHGVLERRSETRDGRRRRRPAADAGAGPSRAAAWLAAADPRRRHPAAPAGHGGDHLDRAA